MEHRFPTLAAILAIADRKTAMDLCRSCLHAASVWRPDLEPAPDELIADLRAVLMFEDAGRGIHEQAARQLARLNPQPKD